MTLATSRVTRPTPGDEAATRRGLAFQLGESHGCIHVKPTDRDDMIRRRFLVFFPGLYRICIVAIERL